MQLTQELQLGIADADSVQVVDNVAGKQEWQQPPADLPVHGVAVDTDGAGHGCFPNRFPAGSADHSEFARRPRPVRQISTCMSPSTFIAWPEIVAPKGLHR